MNIKDLIGKATEYDQKQVLEEKKPKSWCKSVSVFANTFGGTLNFGISEDGHVVGLDNPEGDMVSKYKICSRFNGVTLDIDKLSTSCKTVLNVLYYPDKVF